MEDSSIIEEKKIFVGGLSWNTTKESLEDYFKQFGNVTDCVVMNNGEKPRGFGFVTFEDNKSVEVALSSGREHTLDDKKIDPKPATKKGRSGHHYKLFAGGLSPTTSEEDIKAYFKGMGVHVVSTEIKRNKDGASKGFGFVEFAGEDVVKTVLAMGQYHKINGKDVELKIAKPQNKDGAPGMYNPMNQMVYGQQGYYNPGISRYEGSGSQYGAGSFAYPYTTGSNYHNFPTGYSQAGTSAAAMYQNYASGYAGGRSFSGQQHQMSNYPQEGSYSQSRSGYGGTDSYSSGANNYTAYDQNYTYGGGDQSGGGTPYSRSSLSTQSRGNSGYQTYGR